MRSKDFEDIEFIEPVQPTAINIDAAQGEQVRAPTSTDTELVRLSEDGSQIEYINWKAINKAARQFDTGQRDHVRMIAKILFLFGSIDDQLAYSKKENAAWQHMFPGMMFDGEGIVEKKDA